MINHVGTPQHTVLNAVVEQITTRVTQQLLEALAMAKPADQPAPVIEQPRWMSTSEVATQSSRSRESVLKALRRGLLKGAQAGAGSTWRIDRRDFWDWMDRGAPLDDPAKARLRRMA